MKTYLPRPGTAAYRAIQYFQQNPGEGLATAQLANLLGIDAKKIPALLGKLEIAGNLAKRKLGNGFVWQLGETAMDELPLLDDLPATDDAEGEPSAFSFALWQDGELMINGAQATETGITLTTQQTASLVAYLTNMPAYLDYLGTH
jgi:hypothetical protein